MKVPVLQCRTLIWKFGSNWKSLRPANSVEVFMVFLSPKANTEFAPKSQVALHVSNEAPLPMISAAFPVLMRRNFQWKTAMILLNFLSLRCNHQTVHFPALHLFTSQHFTLFGTYACREKERTQRVNLHSRNCTVHLPSTFITNATSFTILF